MFKKNQEAVSDSKLAIFCYQFAIVLKSGIPYVEALQLLSDEVLDGDLKEYTKSISEKAQEGMLLSEAFRRQNVFPRYMVEMIAISEQTGRLAEVFEGLSEYYQKQDDVKRKLRSALTYPLILLALMFGVLILLVVKILPIFHDILQNLGGDIPVATMKILSVSMGVKNNVGWLLLVLALLLSGILIFIKSPRFKRQRDRLLYQSVFTREIYRTSITVKFSSAMAMLVKSGMNVYEAIEMVIPLMDNQDVQEKLMVCAEKLKQDVSLEVALEETKLFKGIFLKMIQIGLKSGNFEETLEKSSEVYEKELDRSLHKLSVSVEPSLVIILSFIVGAILLLVMLPLVEIMSAIG